MIVFNLTYLHQQPCDSYIYRCLSVHHAGDGQARKKMGHGK